MIFGSASEEQTFAKEAPHPHIRSGPRGSDCLAERWQSPADCSGLQNHRWVAPSGGSNPPLSAKFLKEHYRVLSL